MQKPEIPRSPRTPIVERLRFIDLFAGLGGFHLALEDLGHECVFASEIDETLRMLYQKNFGMPCAGDIRKIEASEIPSHDILCAGFPCQPFSKAGPQEGLSHPELGDLYREILKVIEYHKPTYLILENVPNLARQGNGRTWRVIKGVLEKEGYNVEILTLSPHDFGIPQIRNRIYIVGSLRVMNVAKRLKRGRKHKKVELRPFLEFLETKPLDARPIPNYLKERLGAWQEFLDLIPKGEKFPHPLWAMEFGATYPFQRSTPSATSTKNLRRYRGSFGRRLSEGRTRREAFMLLPSHARRRQRRFPGWKIRFIRRNREFYARYKGVLKEWVKKIQRFPSSFQKFEWNLIDEENPTKEDRRISQHVIQVRPSGVRVKRPTMVPSLVAMNSSQVPIIMWENRFMTPMEGKLLQSMERLRYLPDSQSKSYEALGNAVNVRVARRVALALVRKASPVAQLRAPESETRRLETMQSVLPGSGG